MKPLTTSAVVEPLLCHALHPAGSLPPSVMAELWEKNIVMYMPGGIQSITPSQGGAAVSVSVLVDAKAAEAVESQRCALEASGKKPFFDFNHEDREASFWPAKFYWSTTPAPGIYAKGERTDEGKAKVAGKSYRQFSPVFFVDNVRGNPAHVVARSDAKPNMGGLVNDPAFHSILPFWAKDAGAPTGEQQTQTNTNSIMTPEQLAALQASIKTLEQEVGALSAKAATDASVTVALTAKQAELKNAQLEARNAELVTQNEKQMQQLKARNAADAKVVVDAAVARGAIAAKDTATQTALLAKATEDPSFCAVIGAMQGNAALSAHRMTGGSGVVVVGAGPAETMKAFGALCAKQHSVALLDGPGSKSELAKEALAFYAKHISGNKDMLDMPLSAADSTDGNLGVLAGTLVAMRSLEDYEQQLVPSAFLTTDFSDVPAQFGQTTNSRITVVPAVMGYDNTLGADGRAKGYVVTTPAQTIDVPVILDQHKAVEIDFSTEQLGSTVRNLFGEQANLAGYALALNVNAALLGKITAANFPGAAETGNQPVVIQLADFGRPAFANAAAVMNPLGVPIPGRACLLNSAYYARLSQDPTLVSLGTFQKPEIITGAELPQISKFQPLEASYLPSTGNLVAFFMHKSALVLQTRVPNDYTNVLPGASFGNVSIVKGKSGLTFLLVQYVDHKGAFAGWRIAIMYGTAVGNPKGGIIVKSAA